MVLATPKTRKRHSPPSGQAAGPQVVWAGGDHGGGWWLIYRRECHRCTLGAVTDVGTACLPTAVAVLLSSCFLDRFFADAQALRFPGHQISWVGDWVSV